MAYRGVNKSTTHCQALLSSITMQCWGVMVVVVVVVVKVKMVMFGSR